MAPTFLSETFGGSYFLNGSLPVEYDRVLTGGGLEFFSCAVAPTETPAIIIALPSKSTGSPSRFFLLSCIIFTSLS